MSGRPLLSRRQFLAARPSGGRGAGLAPWMSEACLTGSGIVCRTCGDACPEAAIRFPPQLGGPARPSVLADACTGCGECVPACPAGAVMMTEPTEAGDG